MTEPGLETLIRTQLRRYFVAHGNDLPPPGLYQRILATLEKPLIEESLRATGGNQLKTAAMLGLNRNTLHRKMQLYGLSKPRRYVRRRSRP